MRSVCFADARNAHCCFHATCRAGEQGMGLLYALMPQCSLILLKITHFYFKISSPSLCFISRDLKTLIQKCFCLIRSFCGGVGFKVSYSTIFCFCHSNSSMLSNPLLYFSSLTSSLSLKSTSHYFLGISA